MLAIALGPSTERGVKSYLPTVDRVRRFASAPAPSPVLGRVLPITNEAGEGISTWLVSLAVIPVGIALLLFRRPETLARAEFWADDGLFYQLGLDAGIRALTIPYAGTFVVVQRIIVILETMVPPTLAPVVGNAAAILMTALVAGFIASPRLSGFIPNAAARAAAAIVFVMLPATGWLYWTLADVQWITGTFLVAMLVATPPTTTRGRFGDAIGLLLAGLTGPLSILLLPLYILRALRAPVWRWHVLWLGLAAGAQSLALLLSFRAPAAGLDLAALPEVAALRAIVLPLAGVGAAELPAFMVSVLLLFALGAAVRKLPRSWLVGAAYVVILVPLAGIQATQFETGSLVDPHKGEQYFYLCGVIFAGLILAALARGRRAAVPIAIILALAMVGDARIAPIPAVGWADQAGCIGGPVPCVVPVAPGAQWSVSWDPAIR